MKPWIQDKWQSLTLNEQRIASGLLTVLALLLMYGLLWAPGQKARQRLSISVPEKQAQLALMKLQVNEIAALRSASGIVMTNPQNLKTTIENSARLHKLADSSLLLEPVQDNSVALSLDAVKFNTWIAWMQALQTEHHVRLVQCAVEPGQFADTVRVKATLVGIDTTSAEDGNTP